MTRTRSESVRAFWVGLFVLLAAALLAGGIWMLGESSRIWSPMVEYRVLFSNVQGITRGAPVSVSGYTIGKVRRMELPEDIASGRIEVVLEVEKHNTRFIRGDTRARLKNLGVLMGDKYVDLTTGTMASAELPPGSEIIAIQPPDLDALLDQGESVADNLVVLTTTMRQILAKIDRGEGLLGALVNDTPEGHRIGDDIAGAATAFRSLAEKADTGSGLAALMLNDGRPSADLRAALGSLRRATGALENGEGLAARLLSDREMAERVLANLDETSHQLRRFTDRLNDDRGLLARVTEDGAYADQVLGDLQATSSALAGMARRIEAGEGSLGKLIHDETLYRGLNDIVAGASKSVLTRWFVGRSAKVGAEERLRQTPSPPSTAPPAASPVSPVLEP